MSKLVRPFFAALMCGVMLAGNFPAYLHIASHEARVDGTPSQSSCHSCSGCCHHPERSSDEPEKPGQQDPDHDHQNCHICQSIFTIFSAPQIVSELPLVAFLPQVVCLQSQPIAPGLDLSVPDSRGPPSLAVALT